jgi:hypothetical protein
LTVPAKIHSPQELVAALPTKRYQVQNPDQEVDDHRWDRPTDDAAIVRRGRQAFQRLKGDKTWADWIAVGEALLVGRRAAMLDAHTNRPAAAGTTKYLVHGLNPTASVASTRATAPS